MLGSRASAMHTMDRQRGTGFLVSCWLVTCAAPGERLSNAHGAAMRCWSSCAASNIQATVGEASDDRRIPSRRKVS